MAAAAVPVVPEEVPMLNARLVLIDGGHLVAIEAYADAMPGIEGEKARAYLKHAQTVRRDHYMVEAMRVLRELTHAQVGCSVHCGRRTGLTQLASPQATYGWLFYCRSPASTRYAPAAAHGRSENPMTQTSTETQIALLTAGLAALQREIEENKEEADAKLDTETKRIAALEDERNKALKWGVMTLGSAVLGMAYWIIEKVAGGHIK